MLRVAASSLALFLEAPLCPDSVFTDRAGFLRCCPSSHFAGLSVRMACPWDLNNLEISAHLVFMHLKPSIKESLWAFL